eukprot:Filipodium_phascolosomae@DN1263_c0_g1_i1.p1
MSNRGAFIVFEGLDRCGKSTQTSLLADSLAGSRECVKISFPDRSTCIGKTINEFLKGTTQLPPESAMLLFAANRWENQKKMKELLYKGESVVADRYAHSGIAYASGALGVNYQMCLAADRGVIAPDLVVYLEVDEKAAQQRSNYGEEVFERISVQREVRKYFTEFSKEPAWMIIDASLPPLEIHKKVREKATMVMNAVKHSPLSYLFCELPGNLQQRSN